MHAFCFDCTCSSLIQVRVIISQMYIATSYGTLEMSCNVHGVYALKSSSIVKVLQLSQFHNKSSHLTRILQQLCCEYFSCGHSHSTNNMQKILVTVTTFTCTSFSMRN